MNVVRLLKLICYGPKDFTGSDFLLIQTEERDISGDKFRWNRNRRGFVLEDFFGGFLVLVCNIQTKDGVFPTDVHAVVDEGIRTVSSRQFLEQKVNVQLKGGKITMARLEENKKRNEIFGIPLVDCGCPVDRWSW